jgi:hypothetical protein
MSRIISYRGQLAIGLQDTINLHTNDGKTGYKITKFQIMSSTPGVGDVEFIAQIYKTDNIAKNVNTTPNFNDPTLLAVVFAQDDARPLYPWSTAIIFDNEIFNQDIYINVTDAGGATTPCNYYIELEQMDLTEDQALVAIVKNLRNEQ